MEKKLVYLWSVIVLLSVVLSSALTLDIPEYFKVGGSLEMRPQQQTAITSIVWKHNGDLVAEWVDKESPLTYWGSFNHRTTLDTTTGRLEIRNMSKDDAGIFIVEINNKVQSDRYAARVVKEVSKPTVLVACSTPLESCVLSCDGDTTETGPVIYYWKFGEGEWKKMEKDITINKTEIQSAETFSCRMKNPVGKKESDPEKNPFFIKPSDSVGLGVGLFFLSVVVLAGGVVGYLKRKSIKELVCPHNNGNNGVASKSHETKGLKEKSDNDGTVTE